MLRRSLFTLFKPSSSAKDLSKILISKVKEGEDEPVILGQWVVGQNGWPIWACVVLLCWFEVCGLLT